MAGDCPARGGDRSRRRCCAPRPAVRERKACRGRILDARRAGFVRRQDGAMRNGRFSAALSQDGEVSRPE